MGWSMDRVHRGGPWTWVHVLYTSPLPQIRQPRDASGVISSNDDGKFFFFYFDVNNSIFNDICFALPCSYQSR